MGAPCGIQSLSNQLSESTERLQKRALRIIYPALHCRHDEALEISECTTLHARRDIWAPKTFDKIKESESTTC